MIKVKVYIFFTSVILGLCLRDYNFPMSKGVDDFVENKLNVCLVLLQYSVYLYTYAYRKTAQYWLLLFYIKS